MQLQVALESLSRNDPHLTTLNLSFHKDDLLNNDLHMNQLARALQSNTHVTTMDLWQCRLGPQHVKTLTRALSDNPNTVLKKLGLGGNAMGDEGARAVSDLLLQNTTIQELWINQNDITEQGATFLAEALRSNGTLRKVDLEGNCIRDEGVVRLAEALSSKSKSSSDNENTSTTTTSSSLTKLVLSNNEIGDAGAKALAELLKHNSTLNRLWLDKNVMSNDGARSLLYALDSNQALHWIDVDDNPNLDSGLKKELADLVQENRTDKAKELAQAELKNKKK